MLLQHVADSKGVHGSAQHTHIVRTGALDLAFTVFHATPEVACANHQSHLSTCLDTVIDGLSHRVEDIEIQSGTGLARKGFAADLQKNAPIFGSFHCDLHLFS